MFKVPSKPSLSFRLLILFESTFGDLLSVLVQAVKVPQAFAPRWLGLARYNGSDSFTRGEPSRPSSSDSMDGPLVEVSHVIHHPFLNIVVLSFANILVDALESISSVQFKASSASSSFLGATTYALISSFTSLHFIPIGRLLGTSLKTFDVVHDHASYRREGLFSGLLALVKFIVELL